VCVYSMDLEHLQEIVPVEERNRRGTETSSAQRMSLPCKHRSRAVIKSASASGLSLMIPSGVILFAKLMVTCHMLAGFQWILLWN